MTGDTFYRLYSDARAVLYGDGSLTAEAVAQALGFSERLFLIDLRIRDVIEQARKDIAMEDDLSRLSGYEGGPQQ